ncbi:uncharacterized protein C10orf62 homolog [Pteronotus mesoamericanus]|uniref:uncharacterized protein C10orf62 homolog n=1 Tax=Pteronotus mesoamericanus TaxID=1884717 RepID=UPI0023EDC4D1|nr:uncharacterized protein C10orf62 homolog [Pteronotus parnellii mesoamericanus]
MASLTQQPLPAEGHWMMRGRMKRLEDKKAELQNVSQAEDRRDSELRELALETFVELIQQPSCKVVLGTALLLGGGGLLLWLQRKRRKTASESPQDEHEPQSTQCLKAQNESWIKSHFSRLSEEKLATCSSTATPQPEGGNRRAGAVKRMESSTWRQKEAGAAHDQGPFPSKQKISGSSVVKETHKESSPTDEATWAAVTTSTKEIDAKGRQLANSMLQRAMVYQNSGHMESKDINQEELKALEEVEIKLKSNFLTQRETTVAGMNHTHAFHGHSHHGHQDHPSHPNHQSHSLPSRSHQAYHLFETT